MITAGLHDHDTAELHDDHTPLFVIVYVSVDRLSAPNFPLHILWQKY